MTSFRPSCFRPRHWCSSLGTGSRNVTTYWNSSQSGRSSQRSTGNQLALFRWLSQRRCLPGKSLRWCRESLGVCCLESSQDRSLKMCWCCEVFGIWENFLRGSVKLSIVKLFPPLSMSSLTHKFAKQPECWPTSANLLDCLWICSQCVQMSFVQELFMP